MSVCRSYVCVHVCPPPLPCSTTTCFSPPHLALSLYLHTAEALAGANTTRVDRRGTCCQAKISGLWRSAHLVQTHQQIETPKIQTHRHSLIHTHTHNEAPARMPSHVVHVRNHSPPSTCACVPQTSSHHTIGNTPTATQERHQGAPARLDRDRGPRAQNHVGDARRAAARQAAAGCRQCAPRKSLPVFVPSKPLSSRVCTTPTSHSEILKYQLPHLIPSPCSCCRGR